MLPPPRTNDRRSTVPILLAMLLAGGLGGYFGARLGASALRDVDGIRLYWTDIPLAIVLAFVVILVHELGHVLGGLAGGMRFLMLTTGPFRMHRNGERMHFSFNTSINLWGGVAVMLPLKTDRIQQRFALMIGGGPVASLLLAAAGTLLNLQGTGRWSLAGLVLAIFSTGIFLVTVMPMTAGGFTSDGGQLLALRRSAPGAELRAVIGAIAGASLSGTRPRAYDAGLLQLALEMDGPLPMQLIASLLAALQHIDAGEDPGAHFERIGANFTELPAGQREGIALWIAWYHAALRHDHATAAAWAAEAKGGLVEPMQRDLLEAAMALAVGDAAVALTAATRGAARGPGIDPGGEQLVRDLLERTRAAASTRAQAA